MNFALRFLSFIFALVAVVTLFSSFFIPFNAPGRERFQRNVITIGFVCVFSALLCYLLSFLL